VKVGMVTTWGEKCGLYQYSYNVAMHMPREARITPIGRELWGDGFSNLPELAKDYDVMHIQHHGGLMASMSPEIVAACNPCVITKQCIGDDAVFDAATIKTRHVKTPGWRWVPHGIPTADTRRHDIIPKKTLGCAGVPFEGKGHMEAVDVAAGAGWGVNLGIPDNPHTTPGMADYLRTLCLHNDVDCTIYTDWAPEWEVILRLADSAVQCFYYTRPANGTSGAVRMGLATRRPTIVSRHSQFEDIIETGYVNVADSIAEAVEMVVNYEDLVTPGALCDAWSYWETSKMYLELYKEALGV
jgi:hypothetical protein